MLKARDGIWQASFTLPSGKRVRSSTGIAVGTDKALAWAEHDRIERHHLSLQVAQQAPNAPTLQAVFDAALMDHEPWRVSTSQRTIEGNFKAVAEYFKPDTAMASIGDEEVAAYKRHMVTAGLSPSTINQRLSMLSVLFAQARVRKPEIKRAKVRRGRIRILSQREESLVLEYFTEAAKITRDKQGRERKLGQQRDLDMLDLVPCLLDTGFRIGEMLRVGPSEVSFESRTIAAWETKGDQPRIIPMTKRVASIMTRRLAGGAAKAFPLFTVDSADACWERCREGLGLASEAEFVIHALRHTCCSRMVAEGMDAFRVQKWMGHRNIATTQLYVTLGTRDLTALADTMDRANERARDAQIVGAESNTTAPAQSEPAGTQPVESGTYRTVNPQVPGSSPGRGAKHISDLGSLSDAEPDECVTDCAKDG